MRGCCPVWTGHSGQYGSVFPRQGRGAMGSDSTSRAALPPQLWFMRWKGRQEMAPAPRLPGMMASLNSTLFLQAAVSRRGLVLLPLHGSRANYTVDTGRAQHRCC